MVWMYWQRDVLGGTVWNFSMLYKVAHKEKKPYKLSISRITEYSGQQVTGPISKGDLLCSVGPLCMHLMKPREAAWHVCPWGIYCVLQCGRKANLPKMTMASCQRWVAEGVLREMWSCLGVQTRGALLWVLSLDKYRYLESSQAACLISQELAFSEVQQDLLTTGSLAPWHLSLQSSIHPVPANSPCVWVLRLQPSPIAMAIALAYKYSKSNNKIKQNETLPRSCKEA